MKKILHNINGLRSLGVVLFVCLMANISVGQVAGDFRSAATGVWATVATWQTYDGAAWNAATATPAGTETITIQAGHTITISSAVTISGNGYLKNSGAALVFSAGTIAFTGSSTYESNIVGALPTPASTTWGVGSTCKVTGVGGGTSLTNSSQTFYNFIWDCPLQTATLNLVFADGLTIGGNFTVNNTGTGKIRFLSAATTPKTVNIAGNLNMNNTGTVSSLESTGTASTGLVTVNVGGNVNITGGTLNLINASGPCAWVVTGNFTMTSGSIIKGSGTGTLTFTGSGTHTFNRALAAGAFGATAAASATFILGGTGTLTMGTSVYDGLGPFTVNSGTTLESGHSNGILGNIATTGTKIFSSAANYTFNGTAAQTTSAFVTSPTANAVNNLTINNAAGVALSAPNTVNGILTFTSGQLSLGANNLTIASGGSISGATSSNYIVTDAVGTLTQTFSAAKLFPIGASATSYDPVSITPTAPATFAAKVYPTLTPGLNNATLANAKEWDLTPTAAATADITLTPSNAPNTATPVIGHFVGGVWTEATAGLSGTSFTGTYSNFSPFATGSATAFVSAVLAVELTNFSAKSNGNTNLLAWKTANEKNNKEFQIERSANGLQFTNIGTVKGNGTKASVSDYTFLDEGPLSISYYRLVSVDNNDKKETSNVVTVLRGANGKTKLYPTLVADKMTIVSDSNEPQSFNIFDLTGRNVQKGTFTTQQDVFVSGLATGTYLLKVGNDVVKFIKQ
jgi:hypothetical protein